MPYHDTLSPSRIALSGATLSVIDEGTGPVVLLLHGFPDRGAMWSHQIAYLVDNGYRAIAPDLRGFGDSNRPEGVENYDSASLIGDIIELLASLEIGSVHLVGHDWGATIAWAMAVKRPDLVDTLTALSVGHPRAFFRAGDTQRALAWYILLLLHVGAAEKMLPQRGWEWYRSWAFGGASRQDNDQLDQQLTDLERPGALLAALNWYRANFRPEIFLDPDPYPPLGNVTCPVLAVWSDADIALTEAQMTGSQDFVDGPWHYHRVTGVGHWLPRDAADDVNSLLTEFYSSMATA
jgi:pimeloyl-ACP methyl ester carboxylesterase